MKRVILLLLLVAGIVDLNAQTCKIKIYYDDNGNRIERRLECVGRPAPLTDSSALLDDDNKYFENTDNLAGFQVYPNPSERRINIRLDPGALAKKCSIVLSDMSGKVLCTKDNIKEAISTISLDGYADGTYFVIVLINNRKSSVKIVKQTGNNY